MPSTRRCGVVKLLPRSSLPEASSKAATSVKVPPISVPSRKPSPARDASAIFISPLFSGAECSEGLLFAQFVAGSSRVLRRRASRSAQDEEKERAASIGG